MLRCEERRRRRDILGRLGQGNGSQSALAVISLAERGKDEIDICHELGLKRWQLGNLGFGTGPWTGIQWDEECERRSFYELTYMGRAR